MIIYRMNIRRLKINYYNKITQLNNKNKNQKKIIKFKKIYKMKKQYLNKKIKNFKKKYKNKNNSK